MASQIAPVFKPLYSNESLINLRRLLLNTDQILLSDTLTLNPEAKSWQINTDSQKGLFSVKISDVLDTTKAFLSFGELKTIENQSSPENILKHMQDLVHGAHDRVRNTDYNNVAHQLMELLPEQAVSRLLGQGQGACLVEMPFVTPLPIQGDDGKFTPARMGLLLDSNSTSVSIVLRPISRENFEALTIASPSGLSKDEINAAHRRYADSKVGRYQINGLSNDIGDGSGKQLKIAPHDFAYFDRKLFNDENLHSRAMTIGSESKSLNLALISHKRLQSVFMRNILARGQTPWQDKEHMISEICLLPEVSSRIRAGANPLVALKEELENNDQNLKEPYGPKSKLSLHHEFKAMIDAGYENLAKKAIPNHPFIQHSSPSPSM